MNMKLVNWAACWTTLTTTVGVMIYLWNNLAWAADIERIEAHQLKSEVRQLCYKWKTAPDGAAEMVGDFVMDAVADMCELRPDDPRCEMVSPEEVCQ